MDNCQCVDIHDVQFRYQFVADFFIAVAYFSIPLELIYFVKKSAVFPYRWVLVQFGAFIVLCGATHFINLWMFELHSRIVTVVMTVAKILTAVVSCATALMLVHIIPDLLSVKTRELFLKNKADELDKEMGLIRTQEETGRHVRMLTHEIRSTLDRHTILNTTLVELGKALSLEECALWMPTRNGLELQLTHSLRKTLPNVGIIPIHHPTLKQVFSCNRAVVIPGSSPVAMTRLSSGRYIAGDVVAVRVPLLRLVNFPIVDWPYALMVLMLPSDSARRWRIHELELVEVVADQVAVALSHAAILEESIKSRDLLVEQNIALDISRREAETAVSACNDFLAVMNHEMRMPMHAIITLSSLLQESQLNAEQRSMVETILRNSRLLSKLVDDVLDLSKLEDGSLQLDVNNFNLLSLFREVYKLVKPIAAVKRLSLNINLAPDLPEAAAGDEKRLLQTMLFIIGNAVKFTKEGAIMVAVCMERSEYSRDSEFRLIPSDNSFYIRVQVKDTGVGLNPMDIPHLFTKFSKVKSSKQPATGLGLALCKRFVGLMAGHIWVESEGLGKGCTVSFIVRLGIPEEHLQQQLQKQQQQQALQQQQQLKQQRDIRSVNGMKVMLVNESGVNQMLLKGMLIRMGCEVSEVNSGQQCLELLMRGVRNKFRVVVFDLNSIKKEQYDVMVEIQSLSATGNSLFLALTANTDPSLRDQCLALGFIAVLYKPLALDKMRAIFTDISETTVAHHSPPSLI